MSNEHPRGRVVAYGVPGSQPVAASKSTSLSVSSASPAPLGRHPEDLTVTTVWAGNL